MSLLGGGGGGSKARVTMSFYMTFFYFEGVPYFENVFVKPEDKDKLGEIVTDKLVSKNILIVSLPSKKACSDFKEKYEKLDFNGKKPRISVMLGSS